MTLQLKRKTLWEEAISRCGGRSWTGQAAQCFRFARCHLSIGRGGMILVGDTPWGLLWISLAHAASIKLADFRINANFKVADGQLVGNVVMHD